MMVMATAREENGKFCNAVGRAARTAGILTQSKVVVVSARTGCLHYHQNLMVSSIAQGSCISVLPNLEKIE